eukprot:5337564-Pyramimonas_sp.AAC.1
MEDLATARMSVAQLAQRVIHSVRCEDTAAVHSVGLVRRVLQVPSLQGVTDGFTEGVRETCTQPPGGHRGGYRDIYPASRGSPR